jgi:NADH-quinone oxidoreductase subunit A
MTPLAAYLLLFVAVGAGFILVHLLVGKVVRPNKPEAAKGTIYECGEPTIGSAWIQFDLRFYVVALLFVIFDVEVAFFFPWAEVFGKSCAVAAQAPTEENWPQYQQNALPLVPPYPENDYSRQRLGGPYPGNEDRLLSVENQQNAATLAWTSLVEILVFFGVLLVGFAYLWRRGDLAWVRSLAAEEPGLPPPAANGAPIQREMVTTAPTA